MLAHVTYIERELALDLLVGVFGKTDRAWAGQRFHASGNVDTIAVDIALVDDNVTDIDADAEFDPAIFGNGSVALGQGALDFDRTPGCVNCARKFDQSTVACGFDDPTAMFRYRGIDQFAAASLEVPTTSAVRMAASRRSTRASAIKVALSNRDFGVSLRSGVGCVY